MKFFPLSRVRLGDSAFADAVRIDAAYVRALDADRLLAPFLEEAGLAAKAPRYGNWEEMGLGGQTAGHYLSALSHLWAATGDDDLRERLAYAVGELARAQDAVGTGYVGGVPRGADVFAAVAREGLPAARAFGDGGNWVPWYNLHKTFQGLIDASVVGGDERALGIVTRLADWWLDIATAIDDETFEAMLATEFGGMNEVYSRLAELTGRDDYAAMALRFSHRAILDPLQEGRDALTGLHANTQIPKAVGYAISPDAGIRAAADVFWRTVVDHRSTAIGGNSVREHFHAADDFDPMVEDREGPETCNTYNMLRLTRALAERDLRPEHLDWAERALYNHALSAQHPEGGFVYFTSLRPEHYRVYSTVDECFWCCVGSGIENQARYGEWIFGIEGDALAVNLFLPATIDVPEFGGRVRIETAFPLESAVSVVLDLDEPRTFPLRLRVPEWTERLDGLAVNGETVSADDVPGAVVLEREWRPGDRVTFRAPLTVRAEGLPDGSAWRAFLAGPIVLAARTDDDDLVGLRGDDARWGHIAGGPLRPLAEVPIVTDAAPAALLTETAPLRYLLQTDGADVALEPFSGIHDARYTVYWPVAASGADERRAELRERDAVLELDAATIDHVAFGEQQPETDHDFAGPDSWVVTVGDRHARATRDTLAVTLRDADAAGRILRVELAPTAEATRLVVRVDGQLVAFESFGPLDDGLELDLALGEVRAAVTRVELAGAEGRSTPGIRSVRLLR